MNETCLYVDLHPFAGTEAELETLEGATGVVMDAGLMSPEEAEQLVAPVAVLRVSDVDPFADWREQEAIIWASDAGLEQTARMRDAWPELHLVPRLEVYKPEVIYSFSGVPNTGGGFKFYSPDTAAIKGFRMKEDDQMLEQALAQVKALGFETLWLHATHAESKGNGLDLDLLERARRNFQGDIWLSGGATEERHLANLMLEGGTAAVIVSSALATDCGCDRLQTALATPADRGVPIHFAKKGEEDESKTG